MNKLLKQLTESSGVSGFESEIRLLIRDLVEDIVDDWHVDALGNLLVNKKGTGDTGLKILLDAHMDEVGAIITGVDSNGTYKFATVGGVDSRSLPGKSVHLGKEKLKGVIGLKPIHLLSKRQAERSITTDSLRIDTGAKSKDEAARKVKIGEPVTFATEYQERGGTAFGKAFDDRAGCAVLIELLKRGPFPCDLVCSFSVQEEVGLRGAQVAAFDVNPDAAFILECTPAYDLPNRREVSPNVALGEGPSIYVMDAATIQDPRLVSLITRTAENKGISYQIRRPGGGGTNTAAIQKTGGGIPAATIATPARYIHSPVSLINLADFAKVIDLTEAVIRSVTRDALSPRS